MDDGPSLAAMDDALSAVEERLAPFLDAGVASLSESLPAAERARLSTTLAYAVASLTNGTCTRVASGTYGGEI